MRAEYVIPLQGMVASRIEHLAGDIAAATSTAQRQKLEKERETLLKQQTELHTYDEKLRHYADKKIALDLDDGVKVNYGKFGDLLAEVKAVTGTRDEERELHMSWSKEDMMEWEELGIYPGDGGNVCGECIDDHVLADLISQNASMTSCSYCHRQNDRPFTAPLNYVVKAMAELIREEWVDPANELPFESAEGGYQGALCSRRP